MSLSLFFGCGCPDPHDGDEACRSCGKLVEGPEVVSGVEGESVLEGGWGGDMGEEDMVVDGLPLELDSGLEYPEGGGCFAVVGWVLDEDQAGEDGEAFGEYGDYGIVWGADAEEDVGGSLRGGIGGLCEEDFFVSSWYEDEDGVLGCANSGPQTDEVSIGAKKFPEGVTVGDVGL